MTGKVLKDLSLAAKTAAIGGDGHDLIQYSVNAPVDIDGGPGFNRMVVLGTEFDDNFVVSADGIFGAGLHITYAASSPSTSMARGQRQLLRAEHAAGVAVNLVGGIGWDTSTSAAT